MEEKKDEELSQIKADVLYEGKLDFEEIKNNPILQPVLEANTIYKNMGLIVQRGVAEFDRLQQEILTMIDKNPVYTQTTIVMKLREIIIHARNVIHSQDIQREVSKKVVNDMITNNKTYFELKDKVRNLPVVHSQDFLEVIPKELKKIEVKEEPEVETPRKRGRPKKKKEMSEEELNEAILS